MDVVLFLHDASKSCEASAERPSNLQELLIMARRLVKGLQKACWVGDITMFSWVGIIRGILLKGFSRRGYHGWLLQRGATRIILAFSHWIFASVGSIRYHGGLAKPQSWVQFLAKASVASAAESSLQLKNWGSWWVRQDANKSTSNGPIVLLICMNSWGWIIQSQRSRTVHDSSSATRFFMPGRCSAVKKMFLLMHHFHSSVATIFSGWECAPPRWLMYALADILSVLTRMLMLNSVLRKRYYCHKHCCQFQTFDMELLLLCWP